MNRAPVVAVDSVGSLNLKKTKKKHDQNWSQSTVKITKYHKVHTCEEINLTHYQLLQLCVVRHQNMFVFG